MSAPTLAAPDDLARLAADIAVELGPEWARQPGDDGSWNWRVTLIRTPTTDTVPLEVVLHCDPWRKTAGEKVTISGSYRHTGSTPWRGGMSGDTRVDSIGISASRGPAAIAADMRRRLLPGVEAITADMLTETANRSCSQDRLIEASDTLARVGTGAFELHVPHGGNPRETPKRWIRPTAGAGHVTGEVDVTGGKLTFDDLTAAQMETLLMAYAATL